MENIEVEAVEDRSRAEGGHAIIMLRGVSTKPPTGQFKLAPVDPDGSAAESRPLHDKIFTPLSITQTADSLSLLVGPEVTDLPSLIPGTAFRIELSELKVAGVLLWPAITPVARPKRRNIMTRRLNGDPLPARVGAASNSARHTSFVDIALADCPPPAAAAKSTSEPDPPNAAQSSPRRIVTREGPTSRSLQQSPNSETTSDQRDPAGVTITPAAEHQQVNEAKTAAANTASLCEADRAAMEETAAAIKATISAIKAVDDPLSFDHLSTVPAANLEGSDSSSAQSGDARPPAEPSKPRDVARVASTAAQQAAAKVPNPKPKSSSDRRPAVATLLPATPNKPSQAPAVNTPADALPRRMSALSTAALTAALLIAGQAVALKSLDLSIAAREKPIVSIAIPVAPIASEEPLNQAKTASLVPPRNIYDVIFAGPRSPRGATGEGVPASKAIETAHAMLHGPAAMRDPEEAIYWLKRYLSTANGVENARVALTQLGSAYVEPGRGTRDFTSARLAWELASALGDPVAMCFLGAMYEHGLGVDPTTPGAAIWYERAAGAGQSCVTGNDEAPTK